MRRIRASRTVCVAVLPVVLALGCSSNKLAPPGEADLQKAELNDIYDAYMEYAKGKNHGPERQSDLKSFETSHGMAYRVLTDGKYVLVWGVTGKDAGTVLAYQKDAPTQGGAVLMVDGSVRTMSAAEVQAAVRTKK